MENRDTSKQNSKAASRESAVANVGTPSAPPLDLFPLDLSSELTWIQQPSDINSSTADPFADPSSVDLSNSEPDNPFASSSTLKRGSESAPLVNNPYLPSPQNAVAVNAVAVEPLTGFSHVSAAAISAATSAVDSKLTASNSASPKSSLENVPGETAGGDVAPLTQADVVKRRFYWTSLPSWAISLGVHVALLFLLAAMSMDPIREAIGTALEAGGGNEGETLTDTELPGQLQTAEAEATSEAFSAPTAMVSEVVTMPEITTTEVSSVAGAASLSMNSVTESVLPSSMMGSGLSRVMTSLNGRSAGMRGEMLERFGGTAGSEKSVAAALEWISKHQAPNGGWTFACSKFCRGQCKDDGRKVESVNAATALALLPFLGAGQTHLKGKYKDTIKNGLAFLIKNMDATPGKLPRGSWHEPGGSMYSHGLASIVVCEAYAMTRDPDLVQPAQLAINYLVYAQDPRGGGWWYQPQQPGDTSVAGWCIMALKSGSMANLNVPPETFRGASQFLDFVSTNNGAYYGYLKPSANVRPSLTSVGLLCRMYMGWSKDEPGIKEGVALISKTGPKMDDFYYDYYATQVMRHYGGEEWEKWNTKMRDSLIKSQSSVGHEAGSWFSAGNHGIDGGRLYSTALATMILEVYYRHMPLYTEKSADDEFEL